MGNVLTDKGQALVEYVVAVSVFVLFFSLFTMPRSPLNLMDMMRSYYENIVSTTNNPVP